MNKRYLSTLLVILCMTIAACAPKTAAIQPEASAPTNNSSQPRTLTVLAAASLTESFTELGKLFEGQNKGITVIFNFAGSQALAEQLNQGAKADVFASASSKYMSVVVDANRVKKEDVKTFVLNKLAVILPKNNPGQINELKDLAKAGLKFDLADKSVPVGQYALDFLDKASADASYGKDFKTNVLKNVISYEDNVKGVVAKVSLGEADAGIVYYTDITSDAAQKVSTIAIPDKLNIIATYPIAVIADSQNADLAKDFIELVLSMDGQNILIKYGFSPAPSK